MEDDFILNHLWLIELSFHMIKMSQSVMTNTIWFMLMIFVNSTILLGEENIFLLFHFAKASTHVNPSSNGKNWCIAHASWLEFIEYTAYKDISN